jgi:S1-C subfamily serine protease
MRVHRAPIVACAVALLATVLPAGANDRAPAPVFLPEALRAAAARMPNSRDGPTASLVSVAGTSGARPVYACGVIVAERRDEIVIVTAAHVLGTPHIAFVSAAGERLRVRSTAVIPGHDLAQVTTDRPWRPYAVARRAPPPEIGSRVHLWGPVGGSPFTPHDAVVRPIDDRVTDAPDGAFALDCAACGHGDSGTGVFNDREELVGIVTAGYSADANRILVLSERYPG